MWIKKVSRDFSQIYLVKLGERDCKRNFKWPPMKRWRCQIHKSVPKKLNLIKYELDINVNNYFKLINLKCGLLKSNYAFLQQESIYMNYQKWTLFNLEKRHIVSLLICQRSWSVVEWYTLYFRFISCRLCFVFLLI